MNQELFNQAKEAKSPDELIELAKANGKELTAEQAAEIFGILNDGGEISDDELDQAVGGCKVNGHTVVTCDRKCHCGRWSSGKNGYYLLRNDHCDIRNMWSFMSSGNGPGTDKCGACLHLGFSGGIGYCEID